MWVATILRLVPIFSAAHNCSNKLFWFQDILQKQDFSVLSTRGFRFIDLTSQANEECVSSSH